jgi:predicted regulator of Ras-like GTPase activity (Roadblock/LC7/MglB family)
MATSQKKQNQYNLRSGLVIYPIQQEAIEELLSNLLQQIPARFILLVDITGQVITSCGDQSQIKDLVALGSLVAGDLAASQEIARLSGQYEKAQIVLREGPTAHTFICEAGHHLALLVQISTETPLGWARVLIRQATVKLARLAATVPTDKTSAPSVEPILKQKDLSNLFDDALDSLWME